MNRRPRREHEQATAALRATPIPSNGETPAAQSTVDALMLSQSATSASAPCYEGRPLIARASMECLAQRSSSPSTTLAIPGASGGTEFVGRIEG